jgi:predicted SnoaL-like aldol condensation-catalyzing enzyme
MVPIVSRSLEERNPTMSEAQGATRPTEVDANTALVRRYFEMWNTGDGAVADAVLGATYLDHAYPDVLGPAALRSLVPRFRAANPDARMTVEIVAAHEEFVAVRSTVHFTQEGVSAETAGVALFRVADGKLAEQWSWYPRSPIAMLCDRVDARARRAAPLLDPTAAT